MTEAELRGMLQRMPYRGPDDSGVLLDEGVGLGHLRLSIQDLSQLAAQPMVSHCGRFALTYNGEIYNHQQLREELRARGIEVRSTGDTEVLLEYLAAFGVEATLERVEGMFAFGLWDREQRCLTLARDRHGIKPLLYSRGPAGELRFASEMKAFLDRPHEPDLITLNAVLCGLGGTWGEPTVFRGIRWVGAGEWIVFRAGVAPEAHSFFEIDQFADRELAAELEHLPKHAVVERVDQALASSIDMRLLSDAPVCVFVSGGVDSSLIAALAAERYPGLKLFHADVVGDSERPAAEALARSLGLELQCVAVSDQDVVDSTPLATWHYEMPIGYHHGGCVPFLKVSELAGREGMKVVLTGEGSDEYFLGYPQLSIRAWMNRYRVMTGFLQRLVHKVPALGGMLWPDEEANLANHLRRMMFRYELEERRERAAEAFAFVTNPVERDLHVQSLDLVKGNVRTLLHRNDRLGMSAALESRFPFLGHELARLAVNLPSRYKIRKTARFTDRRHPFVSDKWIVRELADRHMPRELSRRKKFGLRSTFYKRVEIDQTFFDDGFLAQYYGLNRRAIAQLYATTTPLWKEHVYSLEVWGQLFALGWSVDQAREHGRRYVRLRTS